MDEYYLAEIRLFAGNYEPRDWMFCDGRLLSIEEYVALYSLLGITYGGNGRTTFALPDLRGRVPIGAGEGPALSYRPLGSTDGREQVTLSETQVPAHNHDVVASGDIGTATAATGNVWAKSSGQPAYSKSGTASTFAADAVQSAGQGNPHDNVQPALAINYIICVRGMYPCRS